MQQALRNRRAGLAAGLVLALAACWRLAGGGASAPAHDVAMPSAPSGTSSASAIASPPRPVPAAPAVPEALDARLQRLASGGAPAASWQAYRLVRACMRLQGRDGRTLAGPPSDLPVEGDPLAGIPDPAAYCAGLTERMRTGRIAWVERAARAGIEGALVALVEEGPFGDPSALQTRPDDPLVKEWKTHVTGLLGEQAGRGNWTGLYLLFTGFAFGNPALAVDRQSALAYGLALRDIVVRVDGLSEDQAIPFNGPFLDAVRAGLSREQQAQAAAQAAAIVEIAVRRRAKKDGPETGR